MNRETTPQAPHTTIIPPEEEATPESQSANIYELCHNIDLQTRTYADNLRVVWSNLNILISVVSQIEQRIIARGIAKEAKQEFASDRVGSDNAYDALCHYEYSDGPQDQLYNLVDAQMREILSSTSTDEGRREQLHDLTNLLLDCKGRIQHTLDELSKKSHNDSENDPIEPYIDWDLAEAPVHVL